MEKAPEDVLDASQLTFAGDFDLQVMEILTHVRLTRDEVESLHSLLNDVTEALSCIWPGCQVHPFGSIVTGLGIKTSDIDCYVHVPSGYFNYKSIPVNSARNVLRKYHRRFTQVIAISTAKVPIVKFKHMPTGFNCDINFSSMTGVKNSKLIAFLLSMDQRALQLAIIIKYWSKVYKFTGTNLMPNYVLTMMIIFYLQVEYVLPSVAELQMHQGYRMVENWNVAFNDKFEYVSNKGKSLYELLGGFFVYYKNFNFQQNVISPFLGFPINKLLLVDINTMPSEFYVYKQNMLNKLCDSIRLDTPMCIQDPFDHSRNCSVGILKKLFLKINAFTDIAATMFNELQSDHFLETLLTVSPQIGSEVTPPPSNFKNKNKVKKRQIQRQARQRARLNYNSLYIDNKQINRWAT